MAVLGGDPAMEGMTAIVTGAGRGIGRAIAEEFASRGARVVVSSRSLPQLEAVCRGIEASGGEAIPVVCDVTNTADVRHLFETATVAFEGLDILVNNAGVGQFLSLAETTEEIWDTTLDTNLKGAFLCSREALPHFEQNGSGFIINIASVAGARGFSNFAAYSASKAGLIGLSRALREELRPKKIRVSAVLPGATDSPFWDTVSGNWDRAKMIASADVAKVVADVASQPASVLTEEVVIMPAGGAL
ncbi:MAG: SDR family oxidoreductase [Candidatus Sumerlaeaceae bacterium]|nr:SDR family oxidoreductase [Candidatus Sumerlaeaceae bacterium]